MTLMVFMFSVLLAMVQIQLVKTTLEYKKAVMIRYKPQEAAPFMNFITDIFWIETIRLKMDSMS